MTTESPQGFTSVLFQGAPLWEATLWAKVFTGRSPRGLASHKGPLYAGRFPQGTAIRGVAPLDRREGSPPTRDRSMQGASHKGRPSGALRANGFPAELP